MIKMPAPSMSGEGLLPGSLLCLHMAERDKGDTWGPFYEGTNTIGEGSPFMI